MPKRIQVAPHVSVDELGRRYRRASAPVERNHDPILMRRVFNRTSDQVRTDDRALSIKSRNWFESSFHNRLTPHIKDLR